MSTSSPNSRTNDSHSKSFYLYFSLILLAALVLRCFGLESRPLHSDEGVNFFFISKVVHSWIYEYSHENYHGPLYFYLAAIARVFFGESVSALRLPSVFFSMLSFGSILLYQRFFSRRFALLAAGLFAISSSALFQARYAIHEQLFVCISLYLGYYCFAWIQAQELEEKKRLLPWIAMYLALLICVKETFIITCFSIVVALLMTLGPRGALPALSQLGRHGRSLALALLLLAGLVSAIYTAGFRWMRGISELAMTIPQWIGRSHSDIGHHKPFFYYTRDLLAVTEPGLLFVCLLAGLSLTLLAFLTTGKTVSDSGLELLDNEKAGLLFFGSWAASSLLVYSCIPYKMPWLIINTSAPATLFLALACSIALRVRDPFARSLSVGVLLLALLCNGYLSLRFNYSFLPNEAHYSKENPYAYVHTDSQILKLADRISRHLRKYPKDRLLIATDGYWPLPYYLREHKSQIMYIKTEKPEGFAREYQLILVPAKHKWKAGRWLGQRFRVHSSKMLKLLISPDRAEFHTGKKTPSKP